MNSSPPFFSRFSTHWMTECLDEAPSEATYRRNATLQVLEDDRSQNEFNCRRLVIEICFLQILWGRRNVTIGEDFSACHDSVMWSTRWVQNSKCWLTQGVYFRVLFLLSRKLTYPPNKACLKMIFLVPRWDMFVSWRLPPQKNEGQELSPKSLSASPGSFSRLAEVVLFLCETQAFLRSERRTDVALDSNQDRW